jgi:hypothetical protein
MPSSKSPKIKPVKGWYVCSRRATTIHRSCFDSIFSSLREAESIREDWEIIVPVLITPITPRRKGKK